MTQHTIPASVEVAVTERRKRMTYSYVAGPIGGTIYVKAADEASIAPGDIEVIIRRPQVDGDWSGNAHAVMSRHGARSLRNQLNELLGDTE